MTTKLRLSPRQSISKEPVSIAETKKQRNEANRVVMGIAIRITVT